MTGPGRWWHGKLEAAQIRHERFSIRPAISQSKHVDLNPYESPSESTQSASIARAVSPKVAVSWRTMSWRTILMHVIGIITFGFGIMAFYVLFSVTTIHPAYGGAAIGRLITLLMGTMAICFLLGAIVVVNAVVTRRWFRVVYAIPAAAYCVFMLASIAF